MISIHNLTKRYGATPALSDVSMEIPRGHAVALWGHNGAGKTTILRAILGLIRHEGSITVAGFDTLTDGVAARRLMGHVPQELSFHDELTVAETVAFSSSLRGVATRRAQEVIALVGLESERSKAVGALSGGMKQRLAIGIALLADPPVLLLDEPTSNLDAATREQMVHLLQGLRSGNKTLLLTSHNLGEIGLLADNVITLEHGRVILSCVPAELDARLGISTSLHLALEPLDTTRAVAVLSAAGMDARPSGSGLIVETLARDKGKALAVLTQAGIDIQDFEVWR